MFYNVVITEFDKKYKEILPNLTLEQANICWEIYSSKKSVSRVTVIKNDKILTIKEQKKILKREK